jgi:uncharacterized protein YjbJ (UPF0337 family)
VVSARATVAKEKAMNWDIVAGNWKEVKGKLRAQWGKLTDDDLEMIGGKKDQLVGRLQARYGKQKDDAEREVDHWLSSQTSARPTRTDRI